MDHATCFGYFNCYSMESVGIWNQCPSGTHFNPNANQCVSPATYQCPYNRCNNQNRANMVILKTECRKYQVCATGKIQSCPISAPYYDEVNQACTNILPPYAVCAL
ncbi:hypothetical protein KR018_005297 [Drosophila ironensis]|nr:hypothetical protein KR018_005297 [Drosophila ironensis]